MAKTYAKSVRQAQRDAAKGTDVPPDECEHTRLINPEIVGTSEKYGSFEVEAECEQCGTTMYNEIIGDDLVVVG